MALDGTIAVADPAVIYALIEHREAFDKIARPVTDHGMQRGPGGGHCLSKSVEQDGCRVVFQFWIESPTRNLRDADSH